MRIVRDLCPRGITPRADALALAAAPAAPTFDLAAWPERPARLRLPWLAATAIVLMLATTGAGYAWVRQYFEMVPPRVKTVGLYSALLDDRPVTVPVLDPEGPLALRTTADEVRTSVTLWRRMHLAHWNGVAEQLRTQALDRMLARYEGVLMDPHAWDAMSAADWDRVPQPMRTIAYRQMVAYWAGYYDVGAKYDLPPGRVADTLAAIVMSESWFDHRGLLVNTDGSLDIGLAGASDFARTRIRELHARGTVDIAPDDDAYYNPWVATRFVAVWMSLLLDEADGNLERAVRAYNRGIARAGDSLGTAYFEAVRSRLTRFVRNQNAPPAWAHVWTRARELEREKWPWKYGQAQAARQLRRGDPVNP